MQAATYHRHQSTLPHFAFTICFITTLVVHRGQGLLLRVQDVTTMTVLLKNLFTVHFQFDLLKLETNNTRDDEVKHAWIIAR